MIGSIRAKGAKLAIPGVVDLSELAAGSNGVTKIVLESVQELLLKLALQMARDDYETRLERQRQGVEIAKVAGNFAGRAPDVDTHRSIVALRSAKTDHPTDRKADGRERKPSQTHLGSKLKPRSRM